MVIPLLAVIVTIYSCDLEVSAKDLGRLDFTHILSNTFQTIWMLLFLFVHCCEMTISIMNASLQKEIEMESSCLSLNTLSQHFDKNCFI